MLNEASLSVSSDWPSLLDWPLSALLRLKWELQRILLFVLAVIQRF